MPLFCDLENTRPCDIVAFMGHSPSMVSTFEASKHCCRLCTKNLFVMHAPASPPDVPRGFAALCTLRLRRLMYAAASPPDVRQGYALPSKALLQPRAMPPVGPLARSEEHTSE